MSCEWLRSKSFVIWVTVTLMTDTHSLTHSRFQSSVPFGNMAKYSNLSFQNELKLFVIILLQYHGIYQSEHLSIVVIKLTTSRWSLSTVSPVLVFVRMSLSHGRWNVMINLYGSRRPGEDDSHWSRCWQFWCRPDFVASVHPSLSLRNLPTWCPVPAVPVTDIISQCCILTMMGW